MNAIVDYTETFDFSTLYFTSPSSMNGGNYFIKIINGSNSLYIQPPKCALKSGIMKSGKRFYCDLMFNSNDAKFIEWIEILENICHTKLFDNRSKWFESELQRDDIENSFTSPFKIFKSGKFYILRANIPTILEKPNIKIYNEEGNDINISNIKNDEHVATILEIQGIKCSARSFQLEFYIKQMLVIKPVDIFDKFLLVKREDKKEITVSDSNETFVTDVVNEDIDPKDGENVNTLDENTNTLDENTNTLDENTITLDENTNTLDENTNTLDENTNTLDENVTNNLEDAAMLSNNDEVNHIIETEEESNDKIDAVSDEMVIDDGENKNKNVLEEITHDSSVESSIKIDTNEKNDFREKSNSSNDLVEIDVKPSNEEDTVFLKKRNEVYYNMYREALQKAKMAKELSLTNYLEARRIKNTYMLTDLSDDSDLDNSDEESDDDSV